MFRTNIVNVSLDDGRSFETHILDGVNLFAFRNTGGARAENLNAFISPVFDRTIIPLSLIQSRFDISSYQIFGFADLTLVGNHYGTLLETIIHINIFPSRRDETDNRPLYTNDRFSCLLCNNMPSFGNEYIVIGMDILRELNMSLIHS